MHALTRGLWMLSSFAWHWFLRCSARRTGLRILSPQGSQSAFVGRASSRQVAPNLQKVLQVLASSEASEHQPELRVQVRGSLKPRTPKLLDFAKPLEFPKPKTPKYLVKLTKPIIRVITNLFLVWLSTLKPSVFSSSPAQSSLTYGPKPKRSRKPIIPIPRHNNVNSQGSL